MTLSKNQRIKFLNVEIRKWIKINDLSTLMKQFSDEVITKRKLNERTYNLLASSFRILLWWNRPWW